MWGSRNNCRDGWLKVDAADKIAKLLVRKPCLPLTIECNGIRFKASDCRVHGLAKLPAQEAVTGRCKRNLGMTISYFPDKPMFAQNALFLSWEFRGVKVRITRVQYKSADDWLEWQVRL
jgi:hypothetical protein